MKKLLAILVLLATFNVQAAVKLPYVLNSNMVLQREGQTNIWGWASPKKKVTVKFRGEEFTTKAEKDGSWSVKINTGKAGGPFDLAITEGETLTLTNILVGDVWVCGGQSNMEFPLYKAQNGASEIRNAQYPQIRIFNIGNQASKEPASNTPQAQWEVCTPQTIPNFSAVGYMFGKELHLETGIPIGLIGSNWGGTIVETWTSKESCEKDTQTKEWLSRLNEFDAEKAIAEQKKVYDIYRKEAEKLKNPNFTHEYISESYNDASWNTMTLPDTWETIHGMESFDGIVWFRFTVEIPSNFKFDQAEIELSKIDDSDIVWINGKKVGETFNLWEAIRNYKIPEGILKIGKNTIVVRVEDYSGGGGIYGIPSEMYITDGSANIGISGTWKWKKDPTPTPNSPTGEPSTGLQPNQFPTLLYNGMIHPIIPYAIKGAIWYQGESNADALPQALRYEKLFKEMIADWRAKWNVGNFPFYYVQLANYKAEAMVPRDQNWAFLREAQTNTLDQENVGMACIIDIGNAMDIHPTNKHDVAHRLALNALHFDYGQTSIEYAGPRMKNVDIKGDKAIATFDHVADGLSVTDKYGYVKGFAVAGADKVFYFAKASIIANNQVEITCDKVKDIKSVRFLWADNPGEITLFNSINLPAEPFRTDKW